MKLSRYLLLGLALLIGAAAFITTTVVSPLNVATEAILPSLAAAVVAFGGVSAVAWVVVNYLASLVVLGHGLDLRPARFVLPQTGAPQVTAFG